MSRQLDDLEVMLKQLIVEHEKLLRLMDLQHDAVRGLRIKSMEDLGSQHEACRMRISGMESRRQALVQQICASARLTGKPTMSALAEAFPQARTVLMNLREKLRNLA